MKERTKEVPKPEVVERLVEVPKIVEKIVEKQMPPEYKTEETIVEVPQVQIEERVIHNPKVVIQERIIEVPKIEFVERIEYDDIIEYREVPVDKIVEVPEIQYVMREVEYFIPQDYIQEIYVDRYTEVPVVQVQEVVREERVPVIVKRPKPRTDGRVPEPFPEPSLQFPAPLPALSAPQQTLPPTLQHINPPMSFGAQPSTAVAQCMVTITVLNLAALAGDKKMDPFVELRYGDLKVGAGIRTSAKSSGGRNAVWNETLDPVPLVPGNWLMCSVFDFDSHGDHEHIGEAQPRKLEAFDFDSSGTWEGPIKLSKDTGGGGRIPRGQVFLSMQASGPVPRSPQPSSAPPRGLPRGPYGPLPGAVLECLYPGGIAIRTEPRIDAPRTGAVVEPGERFVVAEAVQSPGDSQQFVRLGDGRGWALTLHVGDGSAIVREVSSQQEAAPHNAGRYGSYEPAGVLTPPPPPQTAPLGRAPQSYGDYEPQQVMTPPPPPPRGATQTGAQHFEIGPMSDAQHAQYCGVAVSRLPASNDVELLEAENARLRRALALEAENVSLRADLERSRQAVRA